MRMSAAEQSFECKCVYLFSSLSHVYLAVAEIAALPFPQCTVYAYTSSRDDSDERDLRIILNALPSLIDRPYANAARIRTYLRLNYATFFIIIINCIIGSDIKSGVDRRVAEFAMNPRERKSVLVRCYAMPSLFLQLP